MKTTKLLAGCALACAAMSLCACSTVPGLSVNGATAANGAMKDFLTDPNCAHHDEASFVSGAGGLPASFQAKIMRDCPARPAAAPVAAVTPAPAAP